MIIDTEQIEHNFTINEYDGLKLINVQEIGNEVAQQFIDSDEIWQSDMIYEISLYFSDLINEAFDKAVEVLKENQRDIDVEK